MTILSLDQSSHATGYAIFQNNKLIKHDKFIAEDKDIGKRLCTIREKVKQIISEYNPDYVIFEDIQQQDNVKNNVQTFKILAEVHGVITQLLSELNISFQSVLAASWKPVLGITSKNRAEQKKEAQNYVLNKYHCAVTDDVADAICIGDYYIKTQSCAWG